MTNGPCWTIGSFSGLPATTRTRAGSSFAVMRTPSPSVEDAELAAHEVTAADRDVADERIDEAFVARGDRELRRRARRDLDVEIHRLGLAAADRPGDAVHRAGERSHHRAAVELHARHLLRLHVAVARVAHLVFLGEVQPKLEAVDEPLLLFGHLRVDDPSSCRHPLRAARSEQTFVAFVVLVPEFTGDHVRHRLEAAMRMIRKARQVVLWLIRTKLVEHEERIEAPKKRRTDNTRELHARAVARRHSAEALPDHAIEVHGSLPSRNQHRKARWAHPKAARGSDALLSSREQCR